MTLGFIPQGPDGQHYVVLEVIQLKDEKDNDQAESIITDAAATATHVESSSLVLDVGSGQGIPIGSTFRGQWVLLIKFADSSGWIRFCKGSYWLRFQKREAQG